MKQSNSKGVNNLATTLFFLLFFIMSVSTFAQSVERIDSSGKNLLVQYLGTEDDMMLISVAYSSIDKSGSNFAIYNSVGELLFRDRFTLVQHFDRKFKFPKEEGTLNLVIAGSDAKISRQFDVYRTSKTVHHVVVAK